MQWLEPIQADSSNPKRAFKRANIPNSHRSVTSGDVPFNKVLASHGSDCQWQWQWHAKVVEVLEHRQKALRTAGLLDKCDAAMKRKTGVLASEVACPGTHQFLGEPSLLAETTKDLQSCMRGYLRARSAKYGFRTKEVTIVMLSMESIII